MIAMSDFELLSIVLAIIMLFVAVIAATKK